MQNTHPVDDDSKEWVKIAMPKSVIILLAALFVLIRFNDALAFGPCENKMPKEVSYFPALEECEGNAGVVLTGRFLKSFSVVVRDCNNNDRDPCHTSVKSCGTNQSSPFKVQRTLSALVSRKGKSMKAAIHCLKESGESEVYKLVRRMTIKLRDPVRGPQDVAKICLSNRVKVSNPVEILSVSVAKEAGMTGFNSFCRTQQYLSCDYSYKAICPAYD